MGTVPTTVILGGIFLHNKATGNKDSIFFEHTRIGKNGKPFQIYKFRTMRADSDDILREMLKDEKYYREWKLYHKFENDPRVTKIGRLLRRLSLDELPQCLNILKGDMSVIGPRPLLEGELEGHDGDPRLYNLVRPGLTSWWAANGRSNMMFWERLALEYEYIRNYSFRMDLKCFFRTIQVVLNGKGAM